MDDKLKAAIARELHKWAPGIDKDQTIPIGMANQMAEYIVRIVARYRVKE